MLENYSAVIRNMMKKKGIAVGQKIAVEKDGKRYEGVLMPRSELGDPNILVIKLDNGYNIGLSFRGAKIKKLKQEKSVEFKHAEIKIKKDPGKKTISILHTGGTIASRVDYATGGVIPTFTPEDLITMFPELGKMANIESRLIRSMWSQDMRFAHYNIIAREIEKEVKKGVDGIIITHGTDTLHYTASALAFILEDLPIPVILVGAQRSSDRGSSDAAANIICAGKFIVDSDFGEVAICMHEGMGDETCLILPATKTRKMHTSRRDAFRPINTLAWARINYLKNNIDFLKNDYKKSDKKRKLIVKEIKENIKIGVLTMHTNMYAEEFLFYKNYDGLIIQAGGLGNLPTSEIDEFTKEHTKISNALEEMIKKGVIIFVSPLTIYGRFNLNVYENQRKMLQIGILGNNCDMTAETAFIKLGWLLSNYTKEEAKEKMEKNLRGEISERTPFRSFLI